MREIGEGLGKRRDREEGREAEAREEDAKSKGLEKEEVTALGRPGENPAHLSDPPTHTVPKMTFVPVSA